MAKRVEPPRLLSIEVTWLDIVESKLQDLMESLIVAYLYYNTSVMLSNGLFAFQDYTLLSLFRQFIIACLFVYPVDMLWWVVEACLEDIYT